MLMKYCMFMVFVNVHHDAIIFVIFEYRDIIVCSLHMFIDVDEILHMFMMFLNVHPDAIILQY